MPLQSGDEKSYNEMTVINLMRNVERSYSSLKDILQGNMQSNVLDKLANIWYMESAVTYWAEEVGTWNTMCTNINNDFNTIYKSINTCARNWANACEASWNTLSWYGDSAKVSSNFKAVSSDGRRGILNLSEFETYRTNNLETIKEDALKKLDDVKRACGNSGFVDGSTQGSIEEIVDTIKVKIENTINIEKEAIIKNSGIAKTNVENAVNANRVQD